MHRALCRAFLFVAARVYPSLRHSSDKVLESAIRRVVPMMVWQPVGDDAVLVGYNEAAIQFNPRIAELLGEASSEIGGTVFHAGLIHVLREHSCLLTEAVRCLYGGAGTWRLLRLIHWREEDQTVIVQFIPLERVDVSVKRAREHKKASRV
jgi:superfamily I DNA/RNA helicase